MKRFRFPLRTVETVRAIYELRAREQFSSAVHAYVTAQEHLKMMQARLADLENVLRSSRKRTFRGGDEASFLEAYRIETDVVAKAALELEKARVAMEEARQGWLGARRNLRVVESLEQKAKAIHRHESEREDQAALDDRTSALSARAASSGL